MEIFEKRIEITNSGTPLVDVKRIIDNPPKSRNEKLAALMRRLRMCEELWTGWDKTVITCELDLLPAPTIELFEESTRVTLFSEIPFSNISMEDKLRTCYLYACIKHVQVIILLFYSEEMMENYKVFLQFRLESLWRKGEIHILMTSSI